MNRYFWYYLFFIVSILLISAATLYPFAFVIPKYTSPSLIFEQFRQGSSVKDYWQNILLFIPFGIGLAAILSTTRLKYLTVIIVSTIVSFSFSLTIETLQFFLPIRVSNFSDVATNTIGGLLGTCLYWWRDSIISLVTAIVNKNSNKLSLRALITAFVSYFLVVCLASYILLININFSNWNDNFYLTIGNEATGDRPWQGYIKSFQISDRALSVSEVKQTFLEKQIADRKSNFIVSYLFDRQRESYLSSTDTANILVWQNNSTKNNISNTIKTNNNSILVSGDRWLISQAPASKLVGKLQKSNQFTISAIVATNSTQQIGPARIISISQDIAYRNLTIGQEQSSLNFRVRSPLTGDNGTQPELVVPQVFNNTNFHHLLITFEKNQVNFYIDRETNKYSFFFQPEINFLAYYPFTTLNWQINLANFNRLKYYLTFYAIAFIPLGIIGRFILSLTRNRSIAKILWIIFICLVPPLVFELLYTSIVSQPIREFNLLFGIAILSISVLATGLFYPHGFRK